MNVILLALLIFGVVLAVLVMLAYGVSRYREGYDDAKTEYGLQMIRLRREHKEELTKEWDRGYARGLSDQYSEPDAYELYVDIRAKKGETID